MNQLLTEMDGVEERKGVFLMAATNRPDIVDPAVLRPGRLDKILYVGMPATKDRAEILTAITKVRICTYIKCHSLIFLKSILKKITYIFIVLIWSNKIVSFQCKYIILYF